MTAVAETVAAAPAAADHEPAEAWGRRQTIGFAALSALGTLAVEHLRWGYQFFQADQFVNSLVGLEWGGGGALDGDWFTETSPQPHWTFDLITAVGARLGVLEILYLAYWLLSLFVFGLATAWLSEKWLPHRYRPLGLLVGPLLALASVGVLGSTSPILWYAVPHQLGGSLAYLALAAMITKRYRAAGIIVFLAGLGHVQHGVNVGVVAIVAAAVLHREAKRDRLWLVGGAVATIAHFLISARLRGFFGDANDFVASCERYIPFHCDANTWPSLVLRDGHYFLLLPQLLLLARVVDRWRGLVTITLPAVGMYLTVYADRWDVEPFGELAQGTNAYRLITLVMPFTIWAVVLLPWLCWRAAVQRAAPTRALVVLGLVSLATLFLIRRLFLAEAAVARSTQPFIWRGIGSGRATALAVLVLLALVVPIIGEYLRRSDRETRGVTMACFAAVAIIGALISNLPINNLTVGINTADPRVELSRSVDDILPVGAVIAHPPSQIWVRLWTERAVVSDCKAIPHRGSSVIEYEKRMDVMAGFEDCATGGVGFTALPLEAITELLPFGATHALLPEIDPKAAAARAAGWPELLAQNDWALFMIPGADA